MDHYLEYVWVHGGDNVVEEVGLAREELLGRLTHDFLRFLGVLGGDAVPRLGLAPVQVVDGGCPVVLSVPAEG